MAVTKHIPLSKFQSLIRRHLENAMPLPCWITAEISEIKVNYSGHCYMELVEKGGDNGVPCAKASAVIWRNTYGMVSSYFKSETGVELAAGMNVLLKVTVSYHELYGLSLVIADIDPLYTVGDLERQKQKTIAQLHADGVFDMNRSLPVPVVLQRIAVVSSRNAAGFQDFMNELALSPYGFRVELFDAFMQGHGAEDSVIDALGRICSREDEFDAVVMIRGGGSQSDLAAFDSYRLCCHIAQFPLPVLTGIGHDKDESIADLVAAVSLKTPTAVAAFLADTMEQVDAWLESASAEISHIAVDILENERRTVREAAYKLSQAAALLTRSVEKNLNRTESALSGYASSFMASQRYNIGNLDEDLRRKAGAILGFQRQRLSSASDLISSRDPQKILSLGFAMVRREGKAVTDAAGLSQGDLLEITLHRGKVSARTENVNEN